ncbi:MAG: glycosyltransferase family A protein [Pseudomonadota bacterium]
MPMVPVSVLMVAHNASRFLRPAVESILNQTWSDLELVLVDNASTDGSVAELRLGCVDPRLKILSLDENRGPYGGATAGLPICTGTYIARMDADDESCPQRLAVQVGALEADPGIDVVSCFSSEIDAEGRVTGGQDTLCDPLEIERRAWQEMPIIHAALVARRQVFERAPYRPEFFSGGDYDQILRALDSSTIAALPVRLYHRRYHAGCISTGSRTLQAASGCVARIAWARRLQGEDERLGEELARASQIAARCNSRAAVLAEYTLRCRDLGFVELSLVLARQAYWQDPSARGVARMIVSLARATRHHPERLLGAVRATSRAPLHALLEGLTTTSRPR